MRNTKKMLSFIDEITILQLIEAVALREGSSQSAIMRRAIRKELTFLGDIPTSGKLPPQCSIQEPQP